MISIGLASVSSEEHSCGVRSAAVSSLGAGRSTGRIPAALFGDDRGAVALTAGSVSRKTVF